MHKPCENCPLRDRALIERFCQRCREKDVWGDARRCHELGNMLYHDGEFNAAADAFRAARRHSDEFLLEAAFNLSLSLTRLRHYDEALSAIDEVIDSEPLPEAMYMKGLILRYMERWDEAEHWLKRADEAGHDKAAAELSTLFWMRYQGVSHGEAFSDDPEKKLAYFTGVLSTLDSASPRKEATVLVQAGRAAAETGDYPLARRYFVRACQVDLSAETATELAEFVLDYGGEEEAETAESWLRQAMTFDGAHGRTHHCLGRLQQSRGRLMEAYRSMLSALKAIPSDEYVIFDAAELAAEKGDIAYSLALLARLEQLAGSDHYWTDRARNLRRGIGAS